MRILRSRHQFLRYIIENKQKLIEDQSIDNIARNLSSSYDYQRNLYYFAYQVHLASSYITETISLLMFLDDRELIISGLAVYITKNNLFSLILENDGTRSILDFEHNTGLTLRSLIKDDNLFVKLVEKVV